MIYRLVWKSTSGASEPDFCDVVEGKTYSLGRGENCDVILADNSVSRDHASVRVERDRITLTDNGSANGTTLGGTRIISADWPLGETARIGSYQLMISATDGAQLPEHGAVAEDGTFPPREMDTAIVDAIALQAAPVACEEVDYLTLGGGLGSFVWVDHLRIFGVASSAIRAIGVSEKPYTKYADLCANSQIPLHERLRSNSLSAPDNIWGFPGYASRETFGGLRRGNLSSLKHIIQVFGEPTLAESYTPRAGDVFRAIDREAQRIDWPQIWRSGRILRVRKTNDGRYAVAYRVPANQSHEGPRNHIVVARYLHISTGYPAARFLGDLQMFKNANPSSLRVINAYEPHDAVYQDLEQSGGTVLVRGRGIVASRIIQRIYEARLKNKDIRVLHVMRSPIQAGRTYDLARRFAAHDIEYQPFNWPKACWGGTLRQRLEEASPEKRAELMADWGGTTTADRADWDAILEQGKQEGWYRVFFGNVNDITLSERGIMTSLTSNQEFQEAVRLDANYVIDCTGLIADLEASPLLKDLIETYALARNKAGQAGPETRLAGLAVSNTFEVEGLRNDDGRVFAAGVLTQNGPYAAVDSFLGLQYAALRSVRALRNLRAPGISGFGPLRSAVQWVKWCANSQP